MSHHGAVTGAREPSVGNQGHRIAQPLTDQSAGNRQHLPHTRAALGAFVADDDNVAFFNLAFLYRPECRFFLVEHSGRSLVHLLLVTGHFDDRSLRGQVAVENDQTAGGTARCVGLVDDVLVLNGRRRLHILLQSLTGDGHGVAVEQSGPQQPLGDQGNPAATVQVGHNVFAAGAHIGDVGRAAADAVEVGKFQVYFGLPGNGHQVQHRVGGAAHGHHRGDGVLKGLLGHDVPRPEILRQQSHQGAARGLGFVGLAGVDGRDGGVPRQGHAHHLNGGRHSVGGK